MKQTLILSAAAVALAAIARADEPTTLPATLPTTAPAVQIENTAPPAVQGKSLPAGYAILNTRSIFMKGKVPSPVVPGVVVSPPVPVVRPEHKIVFIGATATEGSTAAMFEDTAAGKIITTKLNESVASGSVTEITLDYVTYTADGKSLKVLVGQALDGTEPPPLTARAVITDNSNGPPTTSPTAATSGESAPTDAATADILEKMRARRRAGQ